MEDREIQTSKSKQMELWKRMIDQNWTYLCRSTVESRAFEVWTIPFEWQLHNSEFQTLSRTGDFPFRRLIPTSQSVTGWNTDANFLFGWSSRSLFLQIQTRRSKSGFAADFVGIWIGYCDTVVIWFRYPHDCSCTTWTERRLVVSR